MAMEIADTKTMFTQLAKIIGFKPLDRLQINSANSISELSIDYRIYGIKNPELPFLYFQRLLPDGFIEARSPGGTAVNIKVTDVCDIIHGESVIVRAMTKKGYIAKISKSMDDKQREDDCCYHAAYVLWASKNKLGQIEPRVWFLDEALNIESLNSSSWIAPIHLDDHKILDTMAKRTVMPISNYHTSANASADKGINAARAFAHDVVNGFIKTAIKGKKDAAYALSSFGAAPVSRAKLNKLAQV